MGKKPPTKPAQDFDIGDHAEGCFDIWCREVGIVATPPRKDRGGWDYYVMLPDASAHGAMLDVLPKLNCSVQVKGQWRSTKTPPTITLSNFQRMISEPIPWFVFVVLYTDANKPDTAALIHIDKQWIEEVSETIWKNRHSKKPRRLNKIHVPLKWQTLDILSALTGKEILDRLRSCIGKAEEYVNRKIVFYQNAGLGDTKYLLNFEIKGDRNERYKELSALAVGEIDELTVAHLDTAEIRFDIKGNQSRLNDVTMSLVPPSMPVTVRFASTTPIRETFDVTFDMYSAASVFPFLPREFRRVRFKIPFLLLDVLPSGAKGTTYRWSFKLPDAPTPLSELVQAARIMSSLLDRTAPSPEYLPVSGTPRRIYFGAPLSVEVPERTVLLFEAAGNAGILAKAFGVQVSEIRVSAMQLLDQRQTLAQLAAICTGAIHDASVTTKNMSRGLIGKRVAYVEASSICLGQTLFIVVLGVTGLAKWIDGNLSVPDPHIRVLEKITATVKDIKKRTFQKNVINVAGRRAEHTMEREGFLLLQQNEIWR